MVFSECASGILRSAESIHRIGGWTQAWPTIGHRYRSDRRGCFPPLVPTGYADTSWNDLAEATGISARTLIRHFSVKSAIAWIGVAPATERLRASLSVAPETAPLTDAVRTAIVESISHRPHIQRVGRDWLRLIAGTPELAAMSSEAYRPWITELADYIGRRVPEVPAAIARALATAYQPRRSRR